MKIGIIGLGNMGRAFSKVFIKSGYQVVASTPHIHKQEDLKDLLSIYVDNTKVAQESDIIFFAVKPQQLNQVLLEIRPYLAGQILVSMAVSKEISWISQRVGDQPIIRIMPNTPVAIGKGVTSYCLGQGVNQQGHKIFQNIMRPTGQIYQIKEEEFDIYSAVAGSLPAFVAMAVEAISDGAVAGGMKRKISYELIAKTMIGTCQLMIEDQLHPGILKDQVTSPGGTTMAGIASLEQAGLRHALIQAIEKTYKKNKEIG